MHQELQLPLRANETGKVPLKANAFESARQGNTQLLPLFPSYLGPGDIVPCCAALESGGKASPFRVGYFLHSNDVDEVAVSYGSEGHIRTGDVHVGPRQHGVGGDSDDPFYVIFVITQRQLEGGVQREALAFQCEKCSHELHRHTFSSANEEKGSYFDVMPTIQGSFDAAVGLNSSPANLTCSQCGHANPEFPLPVWGWGQYVRRSSIAERARDQLERAAAQ